MKCNSLKIIAASFALAAALPAAEVVQTNSFRVERGATLDEAHYVLCNEAKIEGKTRDDLFILAPTLEIGGTIGNDLWFVGSQAPSELKLQPGGKVADHARCAAMSIHLAGEIDNGLLAAGVTVQVATSSLIRGGATILADTAIVAGHFEGDVTVYAKKATISGEIRGSLRVVSDDLVFMPDTVVDGNLIYSSADAIDSSKVLVSGKTIEVPLAAPEHTIPWVGMLLSAAGLILTGLVLTVAFPSLILRSVEQVRTNPGKSTLAGLVGFALLPLLAIAALLTVAGIPLALMALGLLLAFMYTGKIVIAFALGLALLRWPAPITTNRFILSLIVGLIPIMACELIPELGGLIAFVLQITGFGALLQNIWRQGVAGRQTPAVLAP